MCLCNQDFPQNEYEIILPDYGNFTKRDKYVLEFFEKEYPNFRIMKGGKGRCALINEAVKQSKGSIILFAETHCLPHRGWIRQYVALFNNDKICVAEGALRPIPSDTWTGQAELLNRRISERQIDRLGVSFSHFSCHNSGIRKALFLKMGGLSENLFVGEHEFGARLHQNGIDIFQFKECEVWHGVNAGLKVYSLRLSEEGADKSRVLYVHGKTFLKENFPSPTFLRMLPVIGIFRIPLLIAIKSLMMISAGGFYIGKMLALRRVANFYFHVLAVNSHRYGILKGLKSGKV